MADAVVEDEVIDKPLSKEPEVMYHIKVLSDELILLIIFASIQEEEGLTRTLSIKNNQVYFYKLTIYDL